MGRIIHRRSRASYTARASRALPFFAAGLLILLAIGLPVWVAILQRRRRDARAQRAANGETVMESEPGPDPG